MSLISVRACGVSKWMLEPKVANLARDSGINAALGSQMVHFR
jgi:hypothetical protein